MGTRSLVTFKSEWDGREFCSVYRQYDGDPEGRGTELTKWLEGYTVGNGIQFGIDDQPDVKFANGMRELAIKWIVYEKSQYPSGNVYMERPEVRADDLEWIYSVELLKPGKRIRVITTDVNRNEQWDSVEWAIKKAKEHEKNDT